ncbi:hypothetical protein HPP92_011262 [Vanilla planifolia]|uniref:Uncharacterized protein n=1 Tax=Vanilla planifolia TaxID=51239 RepID=A0A835R1I8_VANPL|nr:hypothetical protein HPP92_011262 [Vanilla planifolia]
MEGGVLSGERESKHHPAEERKAAEEWMMITLLERHWSDWLRREEEGFNPISFILE